MYNDFPSSSSAMLSSAERGGGRRDGTTIPATSNGRFIATANGGTSVVETAFTALNSNATTAHSPRPSAEEAIGNALAYDEALQQPPPPPQPPPQPSALFELAPATVESGCVDVNQIMYIFGDWTLRLDVQVIYSSIYALIFIIGLIGNGLLIGTIRKRMTVANVFLINLATSDLLLCITALPITPVLAFVKRWIFGSIMCKLVPLCQGISVLISSYCLCLIAVDRYRSIVTPMKVPWNVAEAQAIMALCWFGSVAISSPLFFTQRLQQIIYENTTLCGEFCGEYDWPQDTRVKLAYGSALLIVQYLIPVSIMTFCYWKILQKVRQDWIVNTGSMLTEAQQAQTSVRKRRVMYVLILMVAVFMGSWMPLTVVNILRDIGVGFLDIQMYFKLLNVHALAMTSIVSNPLLYFWMSKRHRKALKDDMFWFTNVRRQQTQQMGGLLEKFAPSPSSVGIMYRKSLERHLLNATSYSSYRRGTLADPTCMSREKALQEMHSNCFLLVPLMPLCVPANAAVVASEAIGGGGDRSLASASARSGSTRLSATSFVNNTFKEPPPPSMLCCKNV